MQSGIKASEELKQAFQSLLAPQSSHRGLLVGITTSQPESLVPQQTVSAGASLEADLAKLAPLVNDKTATYVLLRDDDNAGKVIGVTYVPDAAPVRQKMLFASTRLTLVRELGKSPPAGSEYFSSTLFATTPEELTADGWAKHEAHGSLAPPLTEEERNLEGIKQAEAQESMGTATRKALGAKSKGLVLDGHVEAALQRLGSGELALVQLEIDLKTEGLKLASTSKSATPASLASEISPSSPRYSVYSHTPSASSKRLLLFIYTCPASSSIKERMLYASASRVTYTVTLPRLGLDVSRRLEASGADEVTEASVLEALGVGAGGGGSGGGDEAGTGSTVSSTRGFARPKRPGKK